MEIIEVNGIRRYFGLMFRTPKTDAIEFVFEKDVTHTIHSFFVFFPFYAAFFDYYGDLVAIKEVKPFTRSVGCNKPYRYLIEVPKTKATEKYIKANYYNIL